MTPSKPPDNGRRPYQKHGLTKAKEAMREWGERAIDGRTRQAKSLEAWRESLVADLGGTGRVSAQQLTIIDMAARTKVLLDGVDGWLFQQMKDRGGAALINQRDRKLFPVVRERQRLADSLARYMDSLGLELREQRYELAEYVAETYGDEEDEEDQEDQEAEE